MGIIKEPLEIDFFVDSRPITAAEEQQISDYIKKDKLIRKTAIKKNEKALPAQ
jgi:hypothetical protein